MGTVVHTALAGIIGDHAGWAVGWRNAGVGDILSEGGNGGVGAYAYTEFELGVCEGEIDSALGLDHAHASGVFAVEIVWALNGAKIGRVVSEIWSRANRNA